MSLNEEKKDYKILLPKSSKHLKEFKNLVKRRKNQTLKAIEKLKKTPTNSKIKGIEKITNAKAGSYSIRVSKGDRIIYDVNEEKNEVQLLRAGKHDVYNLI